MEYRSYRDTDCRPSLLGLGCMRLPVIDGDEGRIDEERRLFYVGITRAKEQLWLSHNRETRRFGERMRLQPSRFIDELPADELQRDGADPVADAARKRERANHGFASIKALLDS